MTSSPRALADDFHEEWLAVNPFAASMYGIPGYDDGVPDVGAEGEAAWRRRLVEVLDRSDAFEPATLSPADAVTLGCVVEAVQRDLLDLDSAAIEHTVTAMPFSGP